MSYIFWPHPPSRAYGCDVIYGWPLSVNSITNTVPGPYFVHFQSSSLGSSYHKQYFVLNVKLYTLNVNSPLYVWNCSYLTPEGDQIYQIIHTPGCTRWSNKFATNRQFNIYKERRNRNANFLMDSFFWKKLSLFRFFSLFTSENFISESKPLTLQTVFLKYFSVFWLLWKK